MKKFKQYLNQRDLWYHGDQHRRTNFLNQNMDRSYDQDSNENGPGIYFTNNFVDALHYAYPEGYVYTVKINSNNIINEKKSFSAKMIERLIDWLDPERREMILASFDDDKNAAIKQYAQHGKNNFLPAAITFYNDFYGRSGANDFVSGLVALGIDGITIDRKSESVGTNIGTKHLVIYNPKVIEIVEEEDYNSAYEKHYGE